MSCSITFYLNIIIIPIFKNSDFGKTSFFLVSIFIFNSFCNVIIFYIIPTIFPLNNCSKYFFIFKIKIIFWISFIIFIIWIYYYLWVFFFYWLINYFEPIKNFLCFLFYINIHQLSTCLLFNHNITFIYKYSVFIVINKENRCKI